LRLQDRLASIILLKAEDLADRRIRSVDDYLKLRRDTSTLIEFGLDLPDEVLFSYTRHGGNDTYRQM